MVDTPLQETDRTATSPAMQEVARAVSTGNLKQAQYLCGQALIKNPENDQALFWNGVIAMECKQFSTATDLFKHAIRNNREIAEYHANLGRCLIRLQQTGEAMRAVDAAMALEPDDAQTLDTIGVIYSFLGYHEDAANAFRRATRIAPEKESFWFNFGSSLKFSGKFDEAEHAYKRAIEINPQLDKARASLSHMRRQTEQSNHIDALREHLKNYQGSLENQTRLGFALAKEQDDIGAYQDAFATLSEYSKHWRQFVGYNLDIDQNVFKVVQETFTKDRIANVQPGHPSAEPIFVIGMPRTGTTLTERIISAHSAVYSAGETDKMNLLIRTAGQLKTNLDFKPAILQHLLRANLAALGEKYIEATRPTTGKTPHFVDKTPLNFLHAGFIMLALPNARIVTVRRNPLDTCLSNFRQLFALNSSHYGYRYSYDLLDTGRYYLMFNELMLHWEKLFPGRIHTIQYENLVENQEQESRRLIEHCGLEWEDNCLEFEKNTAPVTTASSAQVREPMYRDALARWKNYRKELAPLIELLQDAGIETE